MSSTSKKPGGFKGLPKPKEHPKAPPSWCMTEAFDLIRKMDGYGDTALMRDAETVAWALHNQWREGFRRGHEVGARSIVEVASALVCNESFKAGAHR